MEITSLWNCQKSNLSGNYGKKIEKDKWLYDENGQKSGVKIAFKDFDKLMNKLENLHDVYFVYKYRNCTTKTIPFEQVKKELGIL